MIFFFAGEVGNEFYGVRCLTLNHLLLCVQAFIQKIIRVVDDFMQNNCWCGLVPEMEMPAEIDVILRATAARNQVSTDQVLIVGWVDLTKIGVLGQKDVNKVALWCEKLVAKNPTGFLTEVDSSLFCLASVGVLPRPYLD